MPAMKSPRIRVPNEGAGSISDAGMSSTALTASTTMPITWRSPSSSSSTITMQVRLPGTDCGRPKRAARSITGTTAPRRLITPRIESGIIGTSVMPLNSMISFTAMIPMPNDSPPSMKVRYCLIACSM
jgi:hypothetical protein